MSADGGYETTLDARPVLATGGVGDFVALLKPRVMSLVVFTGLVGLMLAPPALHPFEAAVAVACIAVAAGAAGAINMWFDADIDALMRRTATRPIPAGRVDPAEALAFGVVLSVVSVVTMILADDLADQPIVAFVVSDLHPPAMLGFGGVRTVLIDLLPDGAPREFYDRTIDFGSFVIHRMIAVAVASPKTAVTNVDKNHFACRSFRGGTVLR
jgi:hypothetical protein